MSGCAPPSVSWHSSSMELGPEWDLSTVDLFARARVEVAADDEVVPVNLVALHGRPTRLVFDTAVSLLPTSDPMDRMLGVRVLRELGDERPFRDAATAALLSLLDIESDAFVIGWAISALGYQPAPESAHRVASFANHPDRGVRFRVAAALPALTDEDAIDPLVRRTLELLTSDEDADVRYYALTGLTDDLHVPLELIAATIRDRLSDSDDQVREIARRYLAGEPTQD
jgi:HEAT repeat protein